jgi:hypothetical protein
MEGACGFCGCNVILDFDSGFIRLLFLAVAFLFWVLV